MVERKRGVNKWNKKINHKQPWDTFAKKDEIQTEMNQTKIQIRSWRWKTRIQDTR